jgi:hypothetical protein
MIYAPGGFDRRRLGGGRLGLPHGANGQLMRGIFGSMARPSGGAAATPRADDGGGTIISDLTGGQLEEFMRYGSETHSGAVVNERSGMRIAAAWRCIHILAGVCGNNPLDLVRNLGGGKTEQASTIRCTRSSPDAPTVGRPRPTSARCSPLGASSTATATASRSRRWAACSRSGRCIRAGSSCDQKYPGAPLTYLYTTQGRRAGPARAEGRPAPARPDARRRARPGRPHHAREAMGLSLQGEKAGAKLFKQGVLGGGALTTANALSRHRL